ncbi:hypothetical protein V1478_002182 [Vespula squamosa]|uniref:LAGLIDADG homing endonuclease n=1 Tax=Vespula squamosa TaxID=30214 RepID=A0ABD2BWA6_VESSQ
MTNMIKLNLLKDSRKKNLLRELKNLYASYTASVRYDTLTWRAYIKLHGNGQRYYTIEEYQRLPVLFWCLSGIL